MSCTCQQSSVTTTICSAHASTIQNQLTCCAHAFLTSPQRQICLTFVPSHGQLMTWSLKLAMPHNSSSLANFACLCPTYPCMSCLPQPCMKLQSTQWSWPMCSCMSCLLSHAWGFYQRWVPQIIGPTSWSRTLECLTSINGKHFVGVMPCFGVPRLRGIRVPSRNTPLY